MRTPLKLNSLARALERLCSAEPPNDSPFQPGAIGLFPWGEPNPADNFDFVGGVVGQKSLAIEDADPVLHPLSEQVAMSVNARSAEGTRGIGVEHRVNGAFGELDVRVAGADFHGERHLVLAAHDLEGAPGLKVYVSVTDSNCRNGGGGCLEEECVVELFAVVTLDAETGRA